MTSAPAIRASRRRRRLPLALSRGATFNVRRASFAAARAARRGVEDDDLHLGRVTIEVERCASTQRFVARTRGLLGFGRRRVRRRCRGRRWRRRSAQVEVERDAARGHEAAPPAPAAAAASGCATDPDPRDKNDDHCEPKSLHVDRYVGPRGPRSADPLLRCIRRAKRHPRDGARLRFGRPSAASCARRPPSPLAPRSRDCRRPCRGSAASSPSPS